MKKAEEKPKEIQKEEGESVNEMVSRIHGYTGQDCLITLHVSNDVVYLHNVQRIPAPPKQPEIPNGEVDEEFAE